MIKINKLIICEFLLVLLIFFVVQSCSIFTPKTTALENVHNIYRTEFTQYMVPTTPGDKPEIELVRNQSAFVKSLQAIRDFRLKYGESDLESKHLQILEGMIYLQSGRFGMASLLSEEVKEAAEQLRSKSEGYYTRDYLLGMSFNHLLVGWQEINDYNDNDRNTIAEYEKLEAAGISLEKQINGLDESKLSKPEVDQGAIYLAATAAIFYTWVYKLKSEERVEDNTNWFAKGRDLLGKFLTEDEKRIVAGNEQSSIPMSGRLRYLDWYAYLKEKAEE